MSHFLRSSQLEKKEAFWLHNPKIDWKVFRLALGNVDAWNFRLQIQVIPRRFKVNGQNKRRRSCPTVLPRYNNPREMPAFARREEKKCHLEVFSTSCTSVALDLRSSCISLWYALWLKCQPYITASIWAICKEQRWIPLCAWNAYLVYVSCHPNFSVLRVISFRRNLFTFCFLLLFLFSLFRN